MSEARARIRAVEGPYATWDPADPGPFTARAGARLARTEGNAAVILTADGGELTLPPGCLAIEAEDGTVVFCTPERAEILAAGQPATSAASSPVTFEDAARYDEDSPARALGVAGDRAAWHAGGLRITAANGKELFPEYGQVIVRYARDDVAVLDEGEFRRHHGEQGLAA